MENITDLGNGLYLVKSLPTEEQGVALAYMQSIAQLETQRKVLEAQEGLMRFFGITHSIVEPQPQIEIESKSKPENEFRSGFWFGVFLMLVFLACILSILPKEK